MGGGSKTIALLCAVYRWSLSGPAPLHRPSGFPALSYTSPMPRYAWSSDGDPPPPLLGSAEIMHPAQLSCITHYCHRNGRSSEHLNRPSTSVGEQCGGSGGALDISSTMLGVGADTAMHNMHFKLPAVGTKLPTPPPPPPPVQATPQSHNIGVSTGAVA